MADRISQIAVEVLKTGEQKARTSAAVLEVLLTFEPPLARISTAVVEVLRTVDLTNLDQNVSSTCNFSQTVSGGVPGRGRQLFSNPIFSQTASVNIVKLESITSNLNLTQTLHRILNASAHNDLSLTQAALCVWSKLITQHLNLTQAVVLQKAYVRSVNNNLSFFQLVNFNRAFNPGNVVSILQLRYHGRLIPIKNRSTFNTLTLNYELTKTRTLENNNQNPNFTQTVGLTKVKNLTVHNSLIFSQNIARTTRFGLVASNNLVFKHFRIDTIRIGELTELLIPEVIQTVVHPPLISGGGIISRHNQLMTLSVDNRTITLPAPLFGNGVSNTDSFTLSYSITGQPYTTIKRSKTKALSYEWDLPLDKAEELSEFIWDNNAQAIRIETWTGEIWVTRLVSNPISFKDQADNDFPCRGKVQVSLDFEGVRIH
jgi:hypothetical protein